MTMTAVVPGENINTLFDKAKKNYKKSVTMKGNNRQYYLDRFLGNIYAAAADAVKEFISDEWSNKGWKVVDSVPEKNMEIKIEKNFNNIWLEWKGENQKYSANVCPSSIAYPYIPVSAEDLAEYMESEGFEVNEY